MHQNHVVLLVSPVLPVHGAVGEAGAASAASAAADAADGDCAVCASVLACSKALYGSSACSLQEGRCRTFVFFPRTVGFLPRLCVCVRECFASVHVRSSVLG